METCSFPPVFLEMCSPWTRLESLVFKNVHPEDHLSCSGWQQGEVRKPYTVTYDLTESVEDGMFEVSPFFGRVVLSLASFELKSRLQLTSPRFPCCLVV